MFSHLIPAAKDPILSQSLHVCRTLALNKLDFGCGCPIVMNKASRQFTIR